MTNPITTYLNNTVMYRLMHHVLAGLAVVAIAFGFLGWLPFSGVDLFTTFVVLLLVCVLLNRFLANLFHAPVNSDSVWITGLILFFLVLPTMNSLLTTVVVAVFAITSKYLLVWRRRHLFNPVAVGAVVAGLFGAPIFWWVATPALIPFVAIVGLLIVMKTRRGSVVTIFMLCAILSVVVAGLQAGGLIPDLIREALISWPIIFFGTVMLTEPMTLPSKHRHQLMEAALVGLLFAVPFHLGSLYSSPQLVLLIGNLFAFLVSSKATVRLTLVERLEPAPGILDLAFASTEPIPFEAGQYIEWTLPHPHPDARGERRTFTVASAPSAGVYRIGVRLPKEHGSTYKSALAALPIGGVIFASNIGGEFTLPRNPNKNVVLIAGGIGVTPFRSMAEQAIASRSNRSVVLFYCSATPQDFVYQDVFANAEAVGWKTVYVSTQTDHLPATWQGRTGFLTPEIIKQDVPDFAKRDFYLSGPGKMVDSYKKMLQQLGVLASRIHTDYFPGY